MKATAGYTPQAFPAGTIAAAVLFTLTGATTGSTFTATAALDSTEIQLDLNAAGAPSDTYTGTLALVDAANVPLAPAVSSSNNYPFTAAPTGSPPPPPVTVTFNVPSSLSLGD